MGAVGLVWRACLVLGLMKTTAAVYLEEEDTELNETVVCTNDRMDVIIPTAFFRNKVPPVNVWDLHLNDPECRGVEVGEDYVFSIKTNLSDCGTVMHAQHSIVKKRQKRQKRIETEFGRGGGGGGGGGDGGGGGGGGGDGGGGASDDTHIMFMNTIHNNASDIVTRNYVNITFVCRYPVNYMVQQPNGDNLLVRVDVRTITLNTEDGNFSVSMLLYKDQAFQDKWTTVPSLTLDDDIFVKGPPAVGTFQKLNTPPVTRAVTRLAIPDAGPCCPLLASQQTLAVLRNGQGPDAMFRLQMFKFVGSSYTDVFLHCNVQICHSMPGLCRPNCSMTEEGLERQRRDIPLSHTVSYGPIRRLLGERDQPNLNAAGVAPMGTLVLGALLVVLLLVTGVLGRLWLRSRRSYPAAREAQLTLSNIHHISEVAS
ncbi:hypothetical protein CRUP_010488 [Coryphaenoides rupestris]|nr:hypothetical protein CRUP_010488 [Coryphaenoides rupestris]